MKVYLDLELRSDACPAGARVAVAGGADVEPERDAAGFPMLRGRQVKGLLVEEAGLLLAAL
jgi:hypothetical protein